LLRRLEGRPADLATGLTQEFDILPAIRTEAVDLLNDDSTARTSRRKGEIEPRVHKPAQKRRDHRRLVAQGCRGQEHGVHELFDMELRALRRDRAARTGPELFLHERAFTDCLDRIALVPRRFQRALLIGCPDPKWPARLGEVVGEVTVRDPGPLFAAASGGQAIAEDYWEPPEADYDLVLAIGTLDTVNDLPLAARLLHHSLVSGGLFIGAISGGETLPRLRAAMRVADAVAGIAAPHVHPRIEASALAPLLSEAGFRDPVVDVDRVPVSYPSLNRLVGDLRAMGATNLLRGRPHFIGRSARAAALNAFADAAEDSRTMETFEILHFAAWTPA
jgi:hypothetical protein